MLGAIAGDIIGSPYEFNRNNIKTTDFPLFSERSRYTDDSVMTLAIAEALMTCIPERGKVPDKAVFADTVIDSMHEFGHAYPYVGYGPQFLVWLAYDKREPYGSFGNGSAMRVSPVGWAFDTLEDTEEYAELSAAVSHNHPEGIKGARATAAAIFLARTGSTKQQIREYITSKYGYDLSRTIDEIRPSYKFDATCPGSVPEAITAFLDGESYEDTVRKAVSIGGDSDTIACIAGGIAEAFYGEVPEEIARKVFEMFDDDMSDIFAKWCMWMNGGSD